MHDKLMKQVDRTVDIFESKYPFARALFLFDNAPSHRKMADNQLNADVMNVYPGREATINEGYRVGWRNSNNGAHKPKV